MSGLGVLRHPAAKPVLIGFVVLGVVMIGVGMLMPVQSCKLTCVDSSGNNYPVAIVGAVLGLCAVVGLLLRAQRR